MRKKNILSACACVLLAALLFSACGIVYDPNATLPGKPPMNITDPLPTYDSGWSPEPSPYGLGDFTFRDGYLTCREGKTAVGIDVSSYQKEIDWPKVKSAGVQYAIIRIGGRGYGSAGSIYLDEYAQKNLQGARAAGIPIGCYFFSQAISVAEAKEEAQTVLSVLNGMKLELPVVFDWEYVSLEARTGRANARLVTDCTLEFCRVIQNAGYKPMIYFNADHARQRLYLEEVQQYAWWFARYTPEAGPMCKVDLWQYTESGKIAGIEEDVDVNIMFTEWGIGKELFG